MEQISFKIGNLEIRTTAVPDILEQTRHYFDDVVLATLSATYGSNLKKRAYYETFISANPIENWDLHLCAAQNFGVCSASNNGFTAKRRKRDAQSFYRVDTQVEFEIDDVQNSALEANYDGEWDDLGNHYAQEHRYEIFQPLKLLFSIHLLKNKQS